MLSTNHVVAQEQQVQKSSGWMPDIEDTGTPEVSAQPEQAGQTPQIEPEALGDINEAGMTSSVPDTIPDSDFVFKVPVDVKSIHPKIKQIFIYCDVSEKEGQASGFARRIIDLQNGAYKGTVTLGISVKEKFKKKIDMYRCQLRFQMPDHTKEPSQQQGTDIEYRAHPDKPFKIKTGQTEIPEYARY